MAGKIQTAKTKVPKRSVALQPEPPLSVGGIRGRLGVSRKLFSRLTGFSERAIADWEGGKAVSEPGLAGSKSSNDSADAWPRLSRRRPFRPGLMSRTRHLAGSNRLRSSSEARSIGSGR